MWFSESGLWIVGIAVIAIFVVALFRFVFRPMVTSRKRLLAERAMQQFRLQREQLEAKFFDLAAASGKPRGLRWLDCEWQRDVSFARACDTGLLTAFVGVNIRFEAIAGGDMEGIQHVDAVRDAAAVFHYQSGSWGTGGKALFNMNPMEAVTRLVGQFEPLVSVG